MPAKLVSNSYGKSAVRLTKVKRGPDRHELVELEVAIHLTGDFAESYLAGDNRQVIATDTMRNTIYALAANHPIDAVEDFGRALADHFLTDNAHVKDGYGYHDVIHLAFAAVLGWSPLVRRMLKAKRKRNFSPFRNTQGL